MMAIGARALLVAACLIAGPMAPLPAPGQDAAPSLSIPEMESRAASGDAHAAEALADALMRGNGIAANPDRAIALYEKALDLGQESVPYKLAEALARRARPGDSQRAYDILKKFESTYEGRYGKLGEAFGGYLMLMGYVAGSLELYEEALAIQNRNLEIAIAVYGENHGWAAQIKTNLGTTYSRLGHHSEAIKVLQEALPVFVKTYGRDNPHVMDVHNNLAIAYEELSLYEEAAGQYRKALKISLRAYGRRHIETAQLRANLASVIDRLGKFEDSLKLYREAIEVIGEIDGENSVRYARTLADMATVLATAGRYSEALAAESVALPVLVANLGDNHSYVAGVHYAVGNILSSLERNQDAIASYKRALKIFSVVHGEEHEIVATLRADLAAAKISVGRNREAIADFEQVLPVLSQRLGANNERLAILYNNMGIAFTNLGENEKALDAQRKSHEIRVALLGPAHLSVAESLVNVATSLERLGRRDEAMDILLLATPIQTAESQASLGLRRAYWAMARNLRAKGKPRAAALFAKLSINSHEAIRAINRGLKKELRSSLAESLREAYQLLVDQQIADGAFSQAQFVGSLTKSEELSEFTEGDGTAGKVQLTASEKKLLADFAAIARPVMESGNRLQEAFAKRQRLRQATAADDAPVNARQQDFDRAVAEMRVLAQELFERAEAQRQKIQAEVMEQNATYANALQKQLAALDKDVALYQAISTDKTLHLFVTADGRETIHREVAIERTDLARKVYDAVTAIETRAPDTTSRLQELYSLLIAPVANQLQSGHKQVLMLNLSGFLRYVPYAALHSGQRYLIEDHALALFTPAAKTKFAPGPSASATGAGFGVTTALNGFAALPGVGVELEAIFRGVDETGDIEGPTAIDGDFDEARLKSALKAKPRFVHIASHFKFVPGREDNSYLLLGNGKGLSLATLRRDKALRFTGVDLLTLSACETARGGGAEGDEIESFGALAQLNGASAVMATLWQIADQSAARLMADFYNGLIAQDLDKASALQRAQIAMLRGVPAGQIAVRGSRGVTPVDEAVDEPTVATTAHPYYWSAFILMGNWL